MITVTRTDTAAVITLGRDLVWIDQHDWSPIVDSEERTVTGGLVVEPWTRDGGRPITLASVDDELGLVARSTVESLEDWVAVPGLGLSLDLHGQIMSAAFRLSGGAAVTARRVAPTAGPPGADDWLALTLRLRTL